MRRGVEVTAGGREPRPPWHQPATSSSVFYVIALRATRFQVTYVTSWLRDSSFDVVSRIDDQELDNALNQARNEIEGRFDFKNSKTSIESDAEEDHRSSPTTR